MAQVSNAPSGEVADRALMRVIMRGGAWSTVAQLSPVAVNIALTPYLIHHFGVERYGLFILCSSLVTLLGALDGGVGTAVARWSTVYAAREDRAAVTRLITTLSAVTAATGAAMFAALFFCSDRLLTFFGVSQSLLAEGDYLLKSLAVIVAVSQLRGIYAAQLAAHQRYGWQSLAAILSYAVYALGIVVTVETGAGLRGVALTFFAQAAVVTVLTLLLTLPYLSVSEVGLMEWSEFKSFINFASKVQAVGVLVLFINQADTFIVGRAVSVRAVAVYGSGANFANQLRNVPINLLVPMAVAIAQAFGRGGDDEAIQTFIALQRKWVLMSTGWSAVALGSSYFGVSRWLGSDFRTAGVVACVLTLANGVNLWTGTLTVLMGAVGRPGVETRYSAVAVVINLVLTIPGVLLFGLIGTVVATCIGTLVASLYLLRIARRRFRSDLPSFLDDVPLVPALVTIGVVVVLELLVAPFAPVGALGLVVSGLAAAPGLFVYAVLVLGPRRTGAIVARRVRRGHSELGRHRTGA